MRYPHLSCIDGLSTGPPSFGASQAELRFVDLLSILKFQIKGF